MKKKLFLIVSALFFISLFSVTTAYCATTKTVTVTGTYHQSEARAMLDLVNDFRTGDEAFYIDESNTENIAVPGLGKLVWDYDLEKIAMQRAAELVVNYDHTRPDGTTCFTAYEEVTSAFNIGWKGENIAYGFVDTEDMFYGWKEDDLPYAYQGHRRNMLNEEFNSIGIAVIEVDHVKYWAMELASALSGAAASAANNAVTSISVRAIDNSAVIEDGNLDYTLNTLDGGLVSTAANGKPKILVFTSNNPDCGNSFWVVSQLCEMDFSGGDLDVYVCPLLDYDGVVAYRQKFDTENDLEWVYNASPAYTAYSRMYDMPKTLTAPIIFYIDGEDNVHGYTGGYVEVEEVLAERLGLYAIQYDANGGTGAPATRYKDGDKAIKLSSDVPRRSGYRFTGWNTNRYGYGASYVPGQSYTDNAPLTLYAQWEKEKNSPLPR